MKKRAISCLLIMAIIISLLHINIYAEETTNNNNQTTQAFDNLTLLTPEYVQSLIDELNNQAAPTPRLTEDYILSSRTIYTTDNSPLQALTIRPLTPSEIEGYRYDTSVYCRTMTLLCENEEDLMPTSSYNCHYYAWCKDWCDEEYWINYAEPIVDDVHTYTFTNEDNVQVGDIVTYWVDGECKHSAIVYSFINGQMFCKSKWGPNGLFIHPIDDVPLEYKENGQKNVKFHRYTHGEHDFSNIIEDNGEAGHTIKCGANKNNETCSYTTECYSTPTYTSYNSSKHFVSCSDCGCSCYSDHDLYVSDTYNDVYTIECRECSYSFNCNCDREYVPDGSSGHYYNCLEGCFSEFESHTYELTGEYNSSGHEVECIYCGYSEYASHDLYMYYEDVGEYVVKCHDCTYIVECWESPEYYGNSNDGHWVDCPCGCYSFFEPHTPGSYSSTEEGYHEIECADCGYVYTEDCNYGSAETGNSSYHFYECTDCGYELAESHLFIYSQIVNDNFVHNAYCRVCQTTYEKPHNWVSVSGGYECSDCGKTTLIIPDYSSLSDEELSLLLSSMSEEELEAFIALLPEADLARVTAILPPDDEFVTE